MRVMPSIFFRAGLASGFVLDCYRLARYYYQPPDHFLNMPLSVMLKHLHYTELMIKQINASG